MDYKNIGGSPLDVDTTGRRVKVVISEMGSKDLDNDIIDAGAYTKTINERGPSAANLIWHLTDHMPMMKYAVGKFKELYVKGNQLIGVTDIPQTSWGNDVLEFYKSGTINQHSVGFQTMKSEVSEDRTQPRLIKEIKLYEGSAVLWGANPNTPTLGISKGEEKKESESIIKELDDLCKCWKSGKFTDESFELIEIRIKQLQDRIKNLITITTPAAVIAQEPEQSKQFARQLLLLTLQN